MLMMILIMNTMMSMVKLSIKAFRFANVSLILFVFFAQFQDKAVKGDMMCLTWNNTVLDCADACCCEYKQCCACNSLSSVPCGNNNATLIYPLPPVDHQNKNKKTPVLYYECINNATTTPSPGTLASTTTSTMTAATTSTVAAAAASTTALSTTSSSAFQTNNHTGGNDNGDDNTELILIIVCILSAIFLVVVIIGIALIKKKKRMNKVAETPRIRPMTAGPAATFFTLTKGSSLLQQDQLLDTASNGGMSSRQQSFA